MGTVRIACLLSMLLAVPVHRARGQRSPAISRDPDCAGIKCPSYTVNNCTDVLLPKESLNLCCDSCFKFINPGDSCTVWGVDKTKPISDRCVESFCSKVTLKCVKERHPVSWIYARGRRQRFDRDPPNVHKAMGLKLKCDSAVYLLASLLVLFCS